jgi:hypothetical protein
MTGLRGTQKTRTSPNRFANFKRNLKRKHNLGRAKKTEGE